MSIIWGIADDVLRVLYVRGHASMTLLRRLDAVLEPAKQQPEGRAATKRRWPKWTLRKSPPDGHTPAASTAQNLPHHP
jgi:hypothetical protein